MDWCNVSFQAKFSSTAVVTKITFERFCPFMNWCYMLGQISLFRKAFVTCFAFEWFLSFMNWWHVFFQADLSRTAIITNITCKFFFSFMNRLNMSFHVILLKANVTFWCPFFSSCMDAMCAFMVLCLEQLYPQILHSTELLRLRTDALCLFIPSREDVMCWVR